MAKRRILNELSEGKDYSNIPFLQVRGFEEEKKGQGRAQVKGPSKSEAFIAFFMTITMVVSAVTISLGYVSAQIVGMVAFSLLTMSSLLIFGNYLIRVGKLARNAQIYFWIFALSLSLTLFYLVQKGVLPLLFGGALGQTVGIMQFEMLISWLAYIIIALCAVGVILIGLLSPKE